MSEISTEIRQVWLGAKPYVLVELASVELDDDDDVSDFSLNIKFGGGLDRDVIPDLLIAVAEELNGGAESE